MPLSKDHDPSACTGTLVLVVGPSGAGKDTLIDAARVRLAAGPRLVFPSRVITRRPDARFEHNDAMAVADFERAEAAGQFLLAWRSHGLAYGIRADVLGDLRDGRTVVVNVSRTVVQQAEALVPDVAVLHVTASPETLVARLQARGRESGRDLELRAARHIDVETVRAPIVEIRNDGTVEAAAARFTEALLAIVARQRAGNAR